MKEFFCAVIPPNVSLAPKTVLVSVVVVT